MNQLKLCIVLLACLSGITLTGCDGNVAVNYAPVSACGDVDLDPGSCQR